MLSRIAEALFWIGRYIERADGTARILDVHLQLLLEDPWVDEDTACRALLSVMGTAADPGTAVGSVTDPVGQTVDRVDGTVNNAADATGLALATREQVSTGAEIRDSRGNSIGTVQSIDGETAMVTRGGKMYHVPLSGIYHSAAGKTRGLVTKMPRADIKAHTAAAAEAR